ncbi:hypothetical protein L210DRAFT_3633733 [Boletus edulis BED1]|uniref:Uncharacterized protein n=1 Tax=Boletus edulis BED1 TaxID=1328754 RepID=A0AAD4BHS4_BOLED|nr:hypothetical protein L210DRAFT_3633733 [Boletus edulis BED1]
MSSLLSVLETFQSLDYMYAAAAAVFLPFRVKWSLYGYGAISLFGGNVQDPLKLSLESTDIVTPGSGNGLLYMSGLSRRTVIVQIIRWTKLIYIIMLDVIMIFRVSVMFTRPKRTRRILFFLYSIVTINTIVFNVIWYGPHSGFSVRPVVINAEDGTACQAIYAHSSIPSAYDSIPKGIFDILLVALVVYRFIVYSIEMRRITGQHKTNEYMTLLFKDNVLYFCLNFGLSALTYGTYFPSAPIGYLLFDIVYSNSVPYMLFPRMVLSLKGHRAASSAFYVNSGDPGSQRLHDHFQGLLNGLENDNEEETLG